MARGIPCCTQAPAARVKTSGADRQEQGRDRTSPPGERQTLCCIRIEEQICSLVEPLQHLSQTVFFISKLLLLHYDFL